MVYYPLGYRCPVCGDTIQSQKTSMSAHGDVMMEGTCETCKRASFYETRTDRLIELYRMADTAPACDLASFEQTNPPH